MANYNLYDDIDESKLLSLTDTLTKDISTNQSELTEFSDSLSEDMWKASAKETLKAGYTKLDEVFTELSNEVEKVQQACNAITEYKQARAQALDYQKTIDQLSKNVDNKGKLINLSDIQISEGLKSACERTMEECEDKVKGICGG